MRLKQKTFKVLTVVDGSVNSSISTQKVPGEAITVSLVLWIKSGLLQCVLLLLNPPGHGLLKRTGVCGEDSL